MYLDQLKELEITQINEKYNIPYTEKENLEKILKIFVENQLKLNDLGTLEKLKKYAMEPLGVVHLSTVLKENSLDEIRSIHNTLERDGYYNGYDYILVKENINTENLEEEILETLITHDYFIEEAFDLDYLVECFTQEKTHEEVIRELLLEEDLLENLLKIELVDVYVDEDGDVVKMGHKYY